MNRFEVWHCDRFVRQHPPPSVSDGPDSTVGGGALSITVTVRNIQRTFRRPIKGNSRNAR